MKIIAFLRGVNVGGNHKVPMAKLREELAKLDCVNIKTLLNSGNVVFESSVNLNVLEKNIEIHLEQAFGFSIPVILKKKVTLQKLALKDPFEHIEITDNIRLYASFLKNEPEHYPELPWTSGDQSFQIIKSAEKIVFSVLNLSKTKTPKGMDALEKAFGKQITTRNWNTVVKLANL